MSERAWHAIDKSSNIEAIDHDDDGLHVRFKGGAHYCYAGVTRDQFDACKSAESIGKHLRSTIQGKHEFKKL